MIFGVAVRTKSSSDGSISFSRNVSTNCASGRYGEKQNELELCDKVSPSTSVIFGVAVSTKSSSG